MNLNQTKGVLYIKHRIENANCDKNECTKINPEVRLLPYGGGGNMIVCRACYEHEMKYRKERNAETRENRFQLPKWEDLKVYETV